MRGDIGGQKKGGREEEEDVEEDGEDERWFTHLEPLSGGRHERADEGGLAQARVPNDQELDVLLFPDLVRARAARPQEALSCRDQRLAGCVGVR